MGAQRDVTTLLREAGLRPRKGLGQNFLVDDAALQRIVEAAGLTPADAVLEIGPGLGTLTGLLANQARRVVAVELDAKLVAVLQREFAGAANVTILYGDILSIPLDRLRTEMGLGPGETYKVVANLPYYITSAVLRHLLEAEPRPSCMVVTVQQEVAQRIVAAPGDLSLLAISVQLYGIPRIVTRIPAGAFYPAPKVDSAVLRIDLAGQTTVDVEDVKWFFRVVHAGFSARRKQLHNVLGPGLGFSTEQVNSALARASIDPTRRAQTLSLEEWAGLCRELRSPTSSETK